ncbi:MAG: DASH family cryptochrome [Candidatus Methylopumilus sp.]|jgi:deoxyribodipyrimidine photo-lyase|nr:DASH family cryptochrome [Betaproteobacteria bacterium]
MPNITIYWFRNDLRLLDNPAFLKASTESDILLPLFYHPNNDLIYKSVKRVGIHRQVFLKQALNELKTSLKSLNSDLIEIQGNIFDQIKKIADVIGATKIFFEKIIAPEELEQESLIRNLGIPVETFWQSTMIDLSELPFEPQNMPDIFTEFRKHIESKKIQTKMWVPSPSKLPPLPSKRFKSATNNIFLEEIKNEKSSFPYLENQFLGGEKSALAHIENYLLKKLPHSYKETRNQLLGIDFSTKFSPWLSIGCISAKYIAAKLKEFEDQFGANESSYWIWFELLWRDYFRFLHFKYGKNLYIKNGLNKNPININHNEDKFETWVNGRTGNQLIDAGMRELFLTGYLSNRMRQIVASYLIYDLECDWRKGAQWFESQLVDYDVYSNHGNWLYIAGNGTDPRGGRRFNTTKQNLEHDPNNAYKNLWLN